MDRHPTLIQIPTRDEVYRKFPFYRQVPLGWQANLEYRSRLLKKADRDSKLQDDLIKMASADLLFFTSVFLWTYNPRLKKDHRILPMIPWLFQEAFLIEIQDAIDNGYGLFIDKTRYMGASWTILVPTTHKARFEPYFTALLMSRNEDFVDKSEDPKSLFWKIDFMLEHLPDWMQPDPGDSDMGWSRKFKHLGNTVERQTVDGEATTGEAGAGDRRSLMMIDEAAKFSPADQMKVAASASATTDCHIWNSTPQGVNNHFHSLSEDENIRRIRLHWSIHPDFAKGLYTSDGGAVRVLDTQLRGMVQHTYGKPEVMFPDDYPFIPDGKLRSPFYDRECRKLKHPQIIAQELDCDYAASDFQLFDNAQLDIVKNRDCRPPLWEADIVYPNGADSSNALRESRLVVREGGPIKLWVNLDADGKLPDSMEIVLASDISLGSGASNSVTSGADIDTRQKVFEYATPNIKPALFAKQSVALAWAMAGRCRENGPMMIWEASGIATLFRDEILRLKYQRVWKRSSKTETRKPERSELLGWWPDTDAMKSLLLEYARAIYDGDFCERSADTIRECREFVLVRTMGGKVKAVSSKEAKSVDPTGAGEAHGDRAVTSGMLWEALRTTPKTIRNPVAKTKWCFAERRKLRLAKSLRDDL